MMMTTNKTARSLLSKTAYPAALVALGSVSLYVLVSRRVKHQDNLSEPLFQCFSPLHEDECLVLSAEERQQQSNESMPEEMREYSAAEVAQRNNPRDGIWVTYDNKVYDVTDFVESHPGGDRIMMAAGRDLTVFWNAIVHSSDARKMLESYRIGTLRKEDHVNHKEIVKPVKRQPAPENGFDAMLKYVHCAVTVFIFYFILFLADCLRICLCICLRICIGFMRKHLFDSRTTRTCSLIVIFQRHWRSFNCIMMRCSSMPERKSNS